MSPGGAVALLAIADRTRPAAPSAVARITQVTGAAPVLLTGDNQRAAARLAREVGIGDVRPGLLPQDKVAAVVGLQSAGARVLLVGDGINDALDTADAVIMRDDLATIAGHLPLPLGVLGHEGSTVIVGLNGLRLLRAAAWRKATTGGPRRFILNEPSLSLPVP